MFKQTTATLACALLAVLTNASYVLGGSTVWTDPITEEMVLPTEQLSELQIRTHNGGISYKGATETDSADRIVVTKKAGGDDLEAAEAALAAIDVFVEPSFGGTTRIGWKWRQTKRSNWTASVSFEIEGPSRLALDGKTHNGGIKVTGVNGDVKVRTHNGGIDVQSQGGELDAETHNGGIIADHTGGTVDAETHNGGIRLDHAGGAVDVETHNGGITVNLARGSAPEAKIETHNGKVTILVSDSVSATLDLRTHRGKISCDLPLGNSKITKKAMRGSLGVGEGHLAVTTHNGGIAIKTNPE
jgi:DUF4097 and DUF4098 domain-containing protein YvlB